MHEAIILVSFIFSLFIHIEIGNSLPRASQEDIEAVRKQLFFRYDKRIRPVPEGEWITNITFNYKLKNINDLDDIGETLTTTGHLEIRWLDKHLSWNKTKHKDIQYMYVPQNDIWKPDLVLANGNRKISELGGSHYYTAILHTGVVMWDPYEVFTTLCSVDMTFFPFDTQTCYIKFTIWSYRGSDVAINRNSKIIMETIGNGIWTVKTHTSEVKIEKPRYIAEFKIVLQRKPHFFIFNVILPITVLGLVSTFVFLIPVDSGEKTGFSMTVFLSFAVFLTFISAEIPKNSEHTSILNVFIVVEFMLSVTLLLVSSLQLRLLHRTDNQLNKRVVAVIRLSHSLCCKSRKIQPRECKVKDDESSLDFKEHVNDEYSWVDVSNAIDVIAFYVLTITNICIISITFIVLGLH